MRDFRDLFRGLFLCHQKYFHWGKGGRFEKKRIEHWVGKRRLTASPWDGSLTMKPQSNHISFMLSSLTDERHVRGVNWLFIITVLDAFFRAISDDWLQLLFQLTQGNLIFLSAAVDMIVLRFWDCIFNLTLLLLQQDLLWGFWRQTTNYFRYFFLCLKSSTRSEYTTRNFCKSRRGEKCKF